MKDPFSGDVPPQLVARYLQSPDRLASMMQRDPGGWGASPAAIMADIINVLRADTKQLAEIHGVDLDVELMPEDRAAELIAGVTDGDALDIVLLFNELARKRDLVLREALDGDDYDRFMERKTSIMFTDEPDTWDDGATDVEVREAVEEMEEADGGE